MRFASSTHVVVKPGILRGPVQPGELYHNPLSAQISIEQARGVFPLHETFVHMLAHICETQRRRALIRLDVSN